MSRKQCHIAQIFTDLSDFRFLQSPSSSLVVDQEAALYQHSVASVTCLLSSCRLLRDDRIKSCRLLVKGVYSLQIYATEFWTDSVLTVVEAKGKLDTDSALYDLLQRLVSELHSTFTILDGKPENELDGTVADPRLSLLRDHEVIQDHVRRAVQFRSLKRLEQCLQQECCECAVIPAVLTLY